MNITRKKIEEALSKITLPNQGFSIFESNIIKNIQIFGTDIEIDIEIDNPTLQYRKRVEKDCVEVIQKFINKECHVKINISVKKRDVNNNKLTGKEIPGVKNILAVSSAKGGVGKSTIASNIAVGLSNLGYNVGIIDADIYGPSTHIMFGLQGEYPTAINIEGKSKINPLKNYGVKVNSIGFFAQSQEAVVWRGPMASKALNQLLWDTHWGDLDYLIVDLPPGTGDIHLSLVQSIPLTGAIVVSTPQDIALADARKGVSMFQMKEIDIPVLGIIENMSYFSPPDNTDKKYYIFGKSGAKLLSEDLNINLLAEIPIEQSIREASDGGRPAAMQTDTLAADIFQKLSKDIVSIIQKRNLNLPPTKRVEIEHSKGCSTKK
jgi:ATP-binding protein involved in chromosome partitioning